MQYTRKHGLARERRVCVTTLLIVLAETKNSATPFKHTYYIPFGYPPPGIKKAHVMMLSP